MKGEPTKAEVKAYINSHLRDILFHDANKRGVYVGDIIGELLADHYGRPELRGVPRKKVGRKPGTKMPAKKGKKS